MSYKQIKVELCDIWGEDRNAANAAWASTNDAAKLKDKGDEDVRRVVTNLVKLHHDTPKERIWLEFFVTLPIYVERQYDKYRMTQQYQDFVVEFSFAPMGRDNITQNELSGRYRTIPERPYTLPSDVAEIVGRASVTDMFVAAKANVEEWKPETLADSVKAYAAQAEKAYLDHLAKQFEFYNAELKVLKYAEHAEVITNAEYKRAREVLRGVLGTAYLTDMRIVLNMNAFEHIVNQRIDAAAQLESQLVAYHLVDQLRRSGTLPVMIEEMVKTNGWDKRMELIKPFVDLDT